MSTKPAGTPLEYAVVDVFAERALEGNPLAVFTDARGLSTGQMQALARETNLAETTFVLPRPGDEEREQGVRVRIFTTQEELPFAGHPTLGTAAWLYANHPALKGAETIVLDLQAGRIPVRFRRPVEGEAGVYGTMRQNDAVFGETHAREDAARALGLRLEDLDERLPVQTVSTGIPFCLVPVRTLEAMRGLAIPQTAAQRWLDARGAKFFFCVTPADAGSGADFHNRMQFYSGEDPATGSASGCAIAWLVRHGAVPSGKATVFEQGVEIHRPSRVHVQARLAGEGGRGRVTDIEVGGRAIAVAAGCFHLP